MPIIEYIDIAELFGGSFVNCRRCISLTCYINITHMLYADHSYAISVSLIYCMKITHMLCIPLIWYIPVPFVRSGVRLRLRLRVRVIHKLYACSLCTQWGASTPLMLAVKKDHIQIVKTLVINGAEVNAKNQVMTGDGQRHCEGAASKSVIHPPISRVI